MYFSIRGHAAEQGIIFRILTPGQGIIFVKIRFTKGSRRLLFTPKRRRRPFGFCEYDLNRLDGNISTFCNRFLINFQGRAKFCLKKLKDRLLFKNVLLQDRGSFSAI